MVALKFTDNAKSHLLSIHHFIAADSVANAKRFVKALMHRTTILKTYPEIGKKIFPDKFDNLRQLLYKSYRIIYHYSNDVALIITIHHQSRLIENISAVKPYTK
jgi:plasmid stabilization system protein ParE